MTILNIKIRFFFHCLKRQIENWLLRLGCYFFSSWYYIDSDSICTSGNVLKLNSLFTYQENDLVDIVRLTNVHIERGYLYLMGEIVNINGKTGYSKGFAIFILLAIFNLLIIFGLLKSANNQSRNGSVK